MRGYNGADFTGIKDRRILAVLEEMDRALREMSSNMSPNQTDSLASDVAAAGAPATAAYITVSADSTLTAERRLTVTAPIVGTDNGANSTYNLSAPTLTNLGDVHGPGSSTAGNAASFADAGGKTLSDSGIATGEIIVSSSTMSDNGIVRGNGTGRGVQTSTAKVDDNGHLDIAGRFIVDDTEMFEGKDPNGKWHVVDMAQGGGFRGDDAGTAVSRASITTGEWRTPIHVYKIVANVTCAETTGEASLATFNVPDDAMNLAGANLHVRAWGFYSSKSAPTGGLALRLYEGGAGGNLLVEADATPAAEQANAGWLMECDVTVRTAGASSTTAAQGVALGIGNPTFDSSPSTLASPDTTGQGPYTIAAQWDTADADNTITLTNLIAEIGGVY